MIKSRSKLFAALLAFVLLGITNVASAGIIVTVGKPMPEDQARRSKPASGAVAVYPAANGETEKAGGSCWIDKVGTTVCNQKIDPFTGLPADWNCVPIGNGQMYCEGPGVGVGPGEGGEGYLDPSYDVGDDGVSDTEIEAMGCAGGMGVGGGILGAVSLIAMLVVMIRSRRR